MIGALIGLMAASLLGVIALIWDLDHTTGAIAAILCLAVLALGTWAMWERKE